LNLPLLKIELHPIGSCEHLARSIRLLIAKTTHDNFQYIRFLAKERLDFTIGAGFAIAAGDIAMKTLDEQIDDIERLDELRRKARALRQEAIEALTASVYEPKSQSSTPNVDARNAPAAPISTVVTGMPNGVPDRDDTNSNREQDSRAPIGSETASTASGVSDSKAEIAAPAQLGKPRSEDQWVPPGDDVEKAEVLRALTLLTAKERGGEDNQKTSRGNLTKDLTSITLDGLRNTKPPLDSVPIFRCALILQALAETPGHALSLTALHCFNQIIQELNEVSAPDWVKGAARADKKSHATAFITGECARALIALETALDQTASAVKLLGEELTRKKLYVNPIVAWSVEEEKFRKLSLKVSLAALPRAILSRSINEDDDDYANQLLASLLKQLLEVGQLTQPFGDLLKALDFKPFSPLLKHDASANKHTIKNDANLEELGEKISEKLDAAARMVRAHLRPMESFAEFIINREIASSHAKDLVDGAELVFAANLLGLVAGWSRPKVRAAFNILQPLLSTNGRLLSIRPFDIGDRGYRLNVATLETSRRLADLVAKLDVEPEPEFVERLMLPFESTRVAGTKRLKCGWTTDPQPREPKSLWWATALALDALESTVQMLDATIKLSGASTRIF
jgi:hypothetical protein